MDEVTGCTAVAPRQIKITGMDCGSCAMTIENSMRQLPGVRGVTVSFTTETMELDGLEMKIARLRAGLKQYEVAAMLGISQNQLSQIELGRYSPSPEVFQRILEVIKEAEGGEPNYTSVQ